MGICLVSKYSRCRKARLPVEVFAFGIIGGTSGAIVSCVPHAARIGITIYFLIIKTQGRIF